MLSGNCNTAPGTLAGLTPLSRAVFWFDAKGDLNTPETTGSGFLDGTALAAFAPQFDADGRVAEAAIRIGQSIVAAAAEGEGAP